MDFIKKKHNKNYKTRLNKKKGYFILNVKCQLECTSLSLDSFCVETGWAGKSLYPDSLDWPSRDLSGKVKTSSGTEGKLGPGLEGGAPFPAVQSAHSIPGDGPHQRGEGPDCLDLSRARCLLRGEPRDRLGHPRGRCLNRASVLRSASRGRRSGGSSWQGTGRSSPSEQRSVALRCPRTPSSSPKASSPPRDGRPESTTTQHCTRQWSATLKSTTQVKM